MNPGDLVSGKYRLLRLLGSGGMGSVWAARNELTDRDFAIKFLLASLAQNKEALNRFFLEARACGQIKHASIVDVYDMGQAEDGSPYLVMELLEGEGFDARLAREGPFRPVDAASWIATVARGLEEAHQRGLVHRDLKPGNIFFALDERGDINPKVLDFGVSKATGARAESFVKTTTGAVLGSPAYMSPEQAQGETDVDSRSDVWSLGVILYEAITSQVPFDAPNYNALMVAIMMKPHRPAVELVPTLDPELSTVIDEALKKNRDERIKSALELAERLESIVARLTGLPFSQYQPRVSVLEGPRAPAANRASTTQGPWSNLQQSRRLGKTSPILWMSAVSLVIALVAGGVAVARAQAPLIDVAGREAAAIQTGLTRWQKELERIKGEALAEEKAKAAASALPVLEPSDLPPAKHPSSAPAPAAKRPKASSKDPHGGVDTAGF
jgi:serine/threonine-protein kinase